MESLKITKQITNRNTDSVDKYLKEISKFSLITPKEEIELAREIKKNNKAALDKLVRSNLRFVISVAKQYQNMGLEFEDLISEGNLGMIKAAYKFDETKGFKFISYAVWWIRQTILQALTENAKKITLGNKIKGGCVELSDIPFLVIHLIDICTKLAGTIAVIFLLYAGFQMIVSGVSDDREAAKNTIKYALTGLVVSFLAWVIVNLVQVQLTS